MWLVRTPNGIRTRVSALKGRYPRPLDDGGGNPCAPAWGSARQYSGRLRRGFQARSMISSSFSGNENASARIAAVSKGVAAPLRLAGSLDHRAKISMELLSATESR